MRNNKLGELNGKKVKMGIKKGLDIPDFCEKYNCTDDELWVRIGQLFTVKDTARQIWSDIKANEKRKDKKRKAKTTKETADATNVADEATEETAEVTNVVDEVAESTEATTEESTHVSTLKELKAAEAEHSAAARRIEEESKRLHRERENGRKAIEHLRGEIRELLKAHQAKADEVDRLIQEDNELVAQMNALYAPHRAEQAALEEIRAKIKEASKIVLFVYSSREIALSDEVAEISLDDTGHAELFDELREQEAAEDFRPKDLRVVARVIKIVANLGNREVDIIFEDEEIEKAYEVFKKSAK